VCANTVRLALERARAVHRVRHSGDPTSQLHQARAVLGLTVDYYRQFTMLGKRLALEPISERAPRGVLDELYPHDTALGGRALAPRARARDTILALFRDGDTVGNAPGSKWCALNAIVEYTTSMAIRAARRAPSCERSRTQPGSRLTQRR
jgi:uncharacterized protein DUF932